MVSPRPGLRTSPCSQAYGIACHATAIPASEYGNIHMLMIRQILIGMLLFLPSMSIAAPAPVIRPYFETNGKEVDAATVRISQTAGQMTAKLQTPRDGTYIFGISISAATIAPL